MEQLSDFKPLERVALPDNGELRCSGLILVVGPNSSGKSQFLQDLYLRLCGQPRALVVATNIRIRKPENYDSFIQCLESEGYFETITDDNGNQQWIPTRPRVRSISILLLRDQKQMGKHVIEGCPNYLPSQDVDCRCGNQRVCRSA